MVMIRARVRVRSMVRFRVRARVRLALGTSWLGDDLTWGRADSFWLQTLNWSQDIVNLRSTIYNSRHTLVAIESPRVTSYQWIIQTHTVPGAVYKMSQIIGQLFTIDRVLFFNICLWRTPKLATAKFHLKNATTSLYVRCKLQGGPKNCTFSFAWC